MENENLVVEETTENVETQTTEENVEGIELTDTSDSIQTEEEPEKEEVKTYTEEELEDKVKRRLARQREKLERDYQKELAKYKRTEEILKAGLGTSSIEDANEKMANYYKSEGIPIPEPSKPGLSQKQIETLAKAEAEEIISSGKEEIEEELNRLLEIDVKDMNTRDQIVYKKLYEKVSEDQAKAELVKQGMDVSLLENEEFKAFRKKFSKETKLSDVVDLYKKVKPTEQPKKMGSMKSTEGVKVKDYYTPEEIANLTEEDLDNPQIWNAVRKSQQKGYKSNL